METSKKNKTYQELMYIQNTCKLRSLLADLPVFCKDYFRAIEPSTSSRTRLAYAYDIRVFFQFLIKENPAFKSHTLSDFNVSDLDLIKPVDLEEYMEYLKVYKSQESPNTLLLNKESGIYRKMSSLRSFYTYFFKREMIPNNPTLLVDMPKLHEKSIIRLEPDEVAALLDHIEQAGESLTGQRKAYYEKTKLRDFAIVTLLLGTGIRVSELVGLDVQDVNFKNNGIRVIRKGNKEMIVYFGDEVESALRDYMTITRPLIDPLPGEEDALFYSTRRKRIGVQAVQNLVKKYAKEVTPLKKITPHKLRSTYGTTLYDETDDIYLVAEVLGHTDVNTTKKHYAAMSDQKRRYAANKVKLREKKNSKQEK